MAAARVQPSLHVRRCREAPIIGPAVPLRLGAGKTHAEDLNHSRRRFDS